MDMFNSQLFSIKSLNLLLTSTLLYLSGCSSPSPTISHTSDFYNERAKQTLNIPGLKHCSNTSSSSINIDPDEPLTIIVHGCFSSAGKFRALADVYNLHGQQAICFEYNDRDDLEYTSGQLTSAINQLTQHNPSQPLHIIGHSQGGLIARRALIAERQDNHFASADKIQLTTISAPFNGVIASSHCGMTSLRTLSLGLVDLICYAITGKKYQQITPYSDFITSPGKLVPSVSQHLLIKTDENNTCRQFSDKGTCLQDDYVFSLSEQSIPTSDNLTKVTELVVKAGHVEIVGSETLTPTKLINTLKEHKLILPLDNMSEHEITLLIEKIYRNYKPII